MILIVHKIFLAQIAFVFGLVAMHHFPRGLSNSLYQIFNLDREGNFPSWYSSVLLFSVCLASLTIHFSNLHLKNANPIAVRPLATPSWFWTVFGFFYAFLSLDEATAIHEMSRYWLDIQWFYLYAPLGAFIFFASAFALRRAGISARDLQFWILGGLIVYAFGGLVCEAIARIFHPLPTLLAHIEIVLEEALEMIGTTFVLRGCLGEISRLWNVRVSHQIQA